MIDTEADELSLAIATAKDFLVAAFRGEGIENLALEEVEPPKHGTIWHITLGFDRRRPASPQDSFSPAGLNAFLQAAAVAAARPLRVYKSVTVDMAIPKALSISNWKDS